MLKEREEHLKHNCQATWSHGNIIFFSWHGDHWHSIKLVTRRILSGQGCDQEGEGVWHLYSVYNTKYFKIFPFFWEGSSFEGSKNSNWPAWQLLPDKNSQLTASAQALQSASSDMKPSCPQQFVEVPILVVAFCSAPHLSAHHFSNFHYPSTGKNTLHLQPYRLFGFCLDCYTETQNSLDRSKLRPSQTPTNHPSEFFGHITFSVPNIKL